MLLQRSQPLKFDFVSNGVRKDGVCCDRQVLLVLMITAGFLMIFFFFFFFLQSIYFFLLRELNHMEEIKILLHSFPFPFLAEGSLLLFLPPCKWINFLRLIWLIFSIIHRAEHCTTCFTMKSSFPHFEKDSFPNKNVPILRCWITNSHRSILNLSNVRVVLFVVSCTKNPVD